MAPFDLTKKYVDYHGSEIIFDVQEADLGSMLTLKTFNDESSTDWTVTLLNYKHAELLKIASAPIVNVNEVQLIVRQLGVAKEDNDKGTQHYLASVLVTIQAGLPQPSRDDWIDARSCHNAGCTTPLVIMRAKPKNLVQIEIPYAQITAECICCNLLKSVAQQYLDAKTSADPQNTWILAHVDSGGLHLGRLYIAAPMNGLNEVELHTFLEEARRDRHDIMAAFEVKCIDGNKLLLRHHVSEQYWSILQCTLYHNSYGNELPDWPMLPSLRSITTYPLDDPCIAFIKTCWNECELQHGLCAPAQNLLHPRRLLQIGQYEESAIRLIDNDIGHVKFCALSYCWGTSKVACLIGSTLHKFREEIPWATLSRTHQDAVHIARKLSIAYLWIDALCIIQDDRADWFEEASKMRDIYGSAELVICADNGADSESGFLRQRSDDSQWPMSELPEHMTFTRETDGEVKFCLWTQRLHTPWKELTDMPGTWNSNLIYGEIPTREPITERAWCLQEYLSARRCVTFTYHEVIWDCRSQIRCECGRRTSTPGVTGLFKQEFHHIMGRESLSSRAFMRKWRDVVADYSGRMLTQESDKLIAIAGLAKEFASSWDIGSCFAGHWEHEGTILSTLLWGPHQSSKLERTQNHVAPSWSWASTKGSVDFLRYVQGFNEEENFTDWSWEAEVLGGDTQKADDDDFGPVSAGNLVFSASCLRGMFKSRENIKRWVIPRSSESGAGEDKSIKALPNLLIEWPDVKTSSTS